MDEKPLTLNRVRSHGFPKRAEVFKGAPVHIWSAQWQAWWQANSSGYSKNRSGAGVYVFEDAFARTKHCGREKKIEYHIVPNFTPPRPTGKD